MSMEVYSGLYVDESENTRDGTDDDETEDGDGQGKFKKNVPKIDTKIKLTNLRSFILFLKI